MALYLAIPGADYSAAPGKIGTQALLADDPLPILALPGLLNWWRADDAAIASGLMSWSDRVSGKVLAAIATASSPAIITGDAAKKAVQFAGAQVLSGPAAVLNQANTYTILLVEKPADPLAVGTFVFGNQTSTGYGRNWYQFADGSVRARNAANGSPLQPASDSARLVANTTKIVGMSFDVANLRYGFSFNGVLNKYVPVTLGANSQGQTGAEDPATIFAVGASLTVANPLKGDIYDIFLFAGDLHSTANAAVLAYITAKLKSRYGIA